eukprot:4153073-Pyramimonas_sp.AAC.1
MSGEFMQQSTSSRSRGMRRCLAKPPSSVAHRLALPRSSPPRARSSARAASSLALRATASGDVCAAAPPFSADGRGELAAAP